MLQRIEKFEEILEKDLKEELDEINEAGTITHDQVRTVKDAVKLMLKIQKYKEWMNGEGKNSYGDYSYNKGRNAIAGRYVSRIPKNENSGHTRIIENLWRMYDDSYDEKERHMISEWINAAEMSR